MNVVKLNTLQRNHGCEYLKRKNWFKRQNTHTVLKVEFVNGQLWTYQAVPKCRRGDVDYFLL